MTPTRELALQIHREAKKFCKPLSLRVTCVYGGTGISEQVIFLFYIRMNDVLYQLESYINDTEFSRILPL